ncbi:TonB-dependent receptor [Parabacteroides sp. W1-Q-101]|uniref:SusC/RagA family TonB-linked outer membrane protein n=1 Tax=Parabacteroides TaxID=375288 RepID=UPI00202F1483|nr:MULTISPECIES: TonB-dependent receptor [Parabacteroides]MCM0718405.1 TonB-dependent receptor [Parabacteroides sp. W1-Q-101]
MNYRSILKQNQVSLLLIALAFPVSVTTSSLYATTTDVSITQQQKAISGVIFDGAMNEPLIGANVIVKGTTNGTVTDLDGKFTLEANPNDILVISSIGFKTIEIKASEAAKGKIILQEDSKALDEVVIVGYGVQKKVNLTGAVTSIGSEELKERVNTDVLASVQGQVPGVTIITRPGSSPSINMRGRGNLGTSSPLFVIDGAIADASFFSNLDPTSIESISFLKDAASSAIYGSRAAYGVVLVKTKGGKEGDVKVNYDGTVSMKIATYTPKVLGSEWYAKLTNEAAFNDNPNAKMPYSDEEIEMFANGSNPDMYPNTNWYDLVLDDVSVMTKHAVSVSGGNKVKYYTSLGYMYDDKFTPDSYSNRYNLVTNLSSDINSWLSWRSNIKYIQNTSKTDNGGVAYVNLLTVPSTYAARQSNGAWGSYEGGKPASLVSMQRNPLRQLEEGGWSNSKSQNTLINLAVDIKPVKGLVLTGEMIYKAYDYKEKKYEANRDKIKDFKTGLELNGTDVTASKMTYDWNENSRLTYNGLANYTWNNADHDINVLAGVSYEHYQYQQQKSYRKNFPTNGMTGINGGSSAPNDMFTEGKTYEDKLMSYFARINYSFKERYLFEANIRSDASSRFHKDNRWGVFPSFSAGWRISQEDFMKEISWIDNLKLRASWGQLGNINNVGQYDYFSTYAQGGNYNFENSIVNGIIESKPANKNLGWETVTITNIGVDFDVLNGFLNFTGEYYDKQTKDILLAYPSPAEIGINKDNKVSQNIGKVSNKGVEFSVTHNHSFGDFSYTAGFNITKNWNEVKDLGANDPMIDDPWIKKVGYAIGTFYGFRSDGLLTQEDIDKGNYITDGITPQAGDIKYVDLDGDKKLTDKDRDYLGCDVPDITYGVNLNLRYKGFELSMFGQGVTGTLVRFYQEQAWAFSDNASPREYHLKRWTVDNPDPNAAYPRIYPRTSAHSTYNNKFSDFWLFNSDYFRIKNITFGYTFQKKTVQSLGIDALKLYVSAENPFTIRADHRMEDFDPETASGRGTNTRGTSSVSLGVNLTF